MSSPASSSAAASTTRSATGRASSSSLASLAVRQLGPLAGLVLAGFLVTAIRHRAFALLTGSALVITCFFNAAYVNAEIERYYLGPALIAWVWLAILAAAVAEAFRGALPGSRRGRITR